MKNNGKFYDKARKNDSKGHSVEREAVSDDCKVIGRNAVRELLSGERDVNKIFVQRGEREGSITMLIAMAREKKIAINEVEKSRLDVLSGGLSHQGIIAIAAEHNYSTIDDMLNLAKERGEAPFVIICDGVEDPHNLGAIIRSADCCGAHGVIIPKRRAVGLTPVVSKASAGAIFHVPVAQVTNLSMTIDELKEKGFWLYAADMGGMEYHKTDFSGSVALVMGSEGAGISRLVKEKCDFTVSSPLWGSINSMNVSCAAAVILAEIARQRHGKDVE